jgi:ATP-binding cassette subfamily B (MDR/TAP) protein 6
MRYDNWNLRFVQTVKYFGGEAHEAERYREAIRKYQVLEFKVMGE